MEQKEQDQAPKTIENEAAQPEHVESRNSPRNPSVEENKQSQI